MSPDFGVYASLGMDNASLTTQMQGISMEQEVEFTLDHALFSWMEDEDVVLMNDPSPSSTRIHKCYPIIAFSLGIRLQGNSWSNSEKQTWRS